MTEVIGKCKMCGNKFSTKKRGNRVPVFCSISCSVKNLHTKEVVEKRAKSQTGLKRSEETKNNISKSLLGKCGLKLEDSPHWKGGKPICLFCNKKLSTYSAKVCQKHLPSGTQHYNWKKDRTKLVKSEKKHLDVQYKLWMKSVKDRDEWMCRINNKDCNGRLESHHILNWIEYSELRYDINNGITLCHAHHPRGRAKEKRMIPKLMELLSVSNK